MAIPQKNIEEAAWAETALLSAVWRRRWLVVAGLLAGAGAGLVWTVLGVPEYAAEAKILVRYAYEYTPQSVRGGSDDMQVRVDLDMALNTEVQILTTPQVVKGALARAPHPEFAAEADPSPKVLEDIGEKISVGRVEGTSVIRLMVTDENADWALAMAQSLTSHYIGYRTGLFADEAPLAELRTRRHELLDQLNALDMASSSVLSPAGFRSSPVMVTGSLAEAPVQLTTTDAIIGGPATDPKSQQYVSEGFSAERRREATELALTQTEDLIRGIEIRRLMSRQVQVLTPAHLDPHPLGLSPTERVVVAALLGTILALATAVLLAGYEPRRVRHED